VGTPGIGKTELLKNLGLYALERKAFDSGVIFIKDCCLIEDVLNKLCIAT